MALGDLLGGAPEQHHGVGRFQARAGAEGELDLARPELDLDGAQRQAEIDDVGAQDLEDGIHLVVALLGQVLVALVQERHVGRLARLAGLAGVTDAELALLQLEEMELDFQAGDEVVAAIGQRLQRALVDVARVERHRPAVGEEDVAQHPARVRRPGQGAEGGRVGQHNHVGRALQLLHAEARARLPDREHRAVRGVLQQHGGREADAVLQRGVYLARGKRLAAQHAVLVGEGQSHDRHLAGLDAALGLARRRPAFVRPETGPFDEGHAATPPDGERVVAAQLDSLRRCSSNSFQ